MFCAKKVFCLVICLTCILLTACTSAENVVVENDKYKILIEHGQYYLELKETKSDYDGFGVVCEAPPVVKFKSVAEMKSDIISGEFTIEEWREIKRFGSGKMVNLDTLFTPIYPDSLADYTVWWEGSGYGFDLADDHTEMECKFFMRSKEHYDSSIRACEKYYQSVCDREETDLETNARIYTVLPVTEDGTITKFRVYSKKIEGRMFFVEETHFLDSNCSEDFEEVPSSIKIHASDSEGHYYSLYIYDPADFLSDEWLARFGFVPYVEDAEKA